MPVDRRLFLSLFLTLPLARKLAAAPMVEGQILSVVGSEPVKGAVVTSGRQITTTDDRGFYRIPASGTLHVRAPGFRRASFSPLRTTEIRLAPFTPKALYLSYWAVTSKKHRDRVMKVLDETEANTLVLDVKSEFGLLAYDSGHPLAESIGAYNRKTLPHMEAFLGELKAKGIYTIGRMVVFKDNLLASRHPRLALKTTDGTIWKNKEELAWTDPFLPEVWDYNIDLALHAAGMGFDEIQFDYIRFPDKQDLVFAKENNEENRVAAITGFCKEASHRLTPANVFLSADVFGHVCWDEGDTNIGQRLEAMAPHLDYISPMLYPSSFRHGIPSYANPVAHPEEVVYHSLKNAVDRTGLDPERFRPWLQAFRDYGFDRRPFREKEIRAQIRAAEAVGCTGWMLWNAGSYYTAQGLQQGEDPFYYYADADDYKSEEG